MANSSCIREWKNSIIIKLQNNELILNALDTTETEREDLVYKRIFPYLYIPDTQTISSSYINVEISITSTSRNSIYSYPQVVIMIISHQDHMNLSMAGISGSRNDYLSELIDEMLNGSTGYGIGKIVLKSNVAGSLNDTYRYRQLTFVGTDINDNLCGE